MIEKQSCTICDIYIYILYKDFVNNGINYISNISNGAGFLASTMYIGPRKKTVVTFQPLEEKKAMHAVIETGEALPVPWHTKKDLKREE